MSVILFAKEQVYRKLADAYEGLHGLLHASREDDERFYKSLRRLYFANVATFLCQYHNEPGLPQEELIGIDTFSALQGKADPMKSNMG